MKKLFTKKNTHELFEIGVILKAIHGGFEVAMGVVLYFVKYASFRLFFHTIFYGELAEYPRDTLWNYTIGIWRYFSGDTRTFWIFILLSHGITKLFLSAMLLKNKLWAYPVAIVVFTLFVIYQLYTLLLQPSIFLWAFTIYDIVVIFLVYKEYKFAKSLPKKITTGA